MNIRILKHPYLVGGLFPPNHPRYDGRECWVIAFDLNARKEWASPLITYDPVSEDVCQSNCAGVGEFNRRECDRFGLTEAIERARKNPPTSRIPSRVFLPR